MIGALNDFVFADRSAAQALGTLARGAMSIVSQDMVKVMKLLVDAEMRMFKGLNVKAVFLQNIVTDLLLGMGNKEVFIEFADHIKKTYGVDPAFNTMNLPQLVDFLLQCGIENPIICSSINKIGYLMNPDKASYEETIKIKPFRPMAMSIMASGAVPPREAVEYVASQKNIRSIVFGASSRAHIEQTKELIEKSYWSAA